jgi:hypothetical protein
LQRVRLTVRHHYDFGADRALVGDDLVRPEAWDALRTRTTGAFALGETREEWERTADEHPELEARARRLDAVLGARKVASYGVGGATLECWLKRVNPERELVVTDYAPATVERLRPIFTEAECVVHDLAADPPLDADVHLFHRIETEFDDQRWREILARFAREQIVFVAAGQVGLRGAVIEVCRGWLPRASFAGWVRTRAAIEALWEPTHRATPVDVGDLPTWELEPKVPS